MALTLKYAVRSDRGLVRNNNEDSVYAGPRLLAVADGMGGHAAGDVASKVVIAALEHLDDDAPSGDMLQALREAVFDGSEHLREVIRESPQLEGMGTTLTAILFAGGRLGLCHVGDSRAYLLRDGELSQITHDDTFVQTLIDDGVAQLTHEVLDATVLVERLERADDDLARNLAGRVAAHAVGDGEQPWPRVDRVLVVPPDQTAVAACREAQTQAHVRSSSAVWPMRIGVPGVTSSGPCTRCWSR